MFLLHFAHGHSFVTVMHAFCEHIYFNAIHSNTVNAHSRADSMRKESELLGWTTLSCIQSNWRSIRASCQCEAHRGDWDTGTTNNCKACKDLQGWHNCHLQSMHACAWTTHCALGQFRAPGHQGNSERPWQWVGTEPPTIASVREDLGLRLHTNVAGDIYEQSFIYKPSARLIDAFNASIALFAVFGRFWCQDLRGIGVYTLGSCVIGLLCARITW